jgi:uncharacterized protein YerC
MKVKYKKLTKEDRIKCLDALYTAIGCLKSRDDIKLFLRDLLTSSERIMIGRRIIIAQMLIDGYSHRNIAGEIGVGMDTIFRVQRWLTDDKKGYEKTIEKFNRELKKRNKSNAYLMSGSFADIKKRYKGYYWLDDLLEELQQ